MTGVGDIVDGLVEVRMIEDIEEAGTEDERLALGKEMHFGVLQHTQIAIEIAWSAELVAALLPESGGSRRKVRRDQAELVWIAAAGLCPAGVVGKHGCAIVGCGEIACRAAVDDGKRKPGAGNKRSGNGPSRGQQLGRTAGPGLDGRSPHITGSERVAGVRIVVSIVGMRVGWNLGILQARGCAVTPRGETVIGNIVEGVAPGIGAGRLKAAGKIMPN